MLLILLQLLLVSFGAQARSPYICDSEALMDVARCGLSFPRRSTRSTRDLTLKHLGRGMGVCFFGRGKDRGLLFVEAPVLAWGELPSARTDCNSGGTFSKSPVDKYVSAITTHNKIFSFYHNDLISAEDTSIFVSGLTGGLGRQGSWSSRPFRRF